MYAVINGTHLEIELKIGQKTQGLMSKKNGSKRLAKASADLAQAAERFPNLTKLQISRLEAWRKAGAFSQIVSSIEELEQFLTGLEAEGVLPPRAIRPSTAAVKGA